MGGCHAGGSGEGQEGNCLILDWRFWITDCLIIHPRAYFPNFPIHLFIDLVLDLVIFRGSVPVHLPRLSMGENDD